MTVAHLPPGRAAVLVDALTAARPAIRAALELAELDGEQLRQRIEADPDGVADTVRRAESVSRILRDALRVVVDLHGQMTAPPDPGYLGMASEFAKREQARQRRRGGRC